VDVIVVVCVAVVVGVDVDVDVVVVDAGIYTVVVVFYVCGVVAGVGVCCDDDCYVSVCYAIAIVDVFVVLLVFLR